ncbi:glycoside hydrolase family 3 N-terminal domain-containing protein [Zhouia sp. PK063]|uniref:glycoside hydrolase family 3 N-terminal domain-containing protein n=1 Tax=Zhouia sp. PK063 TaxID=3373602 RepID=UPI00379263AF
MRKHFLLFFILITSHLFSQENYPLIAKDAEAQKQWVDSVYNTMSIQQRIGQLFMAAVYSSKDKAHTDIIKDEIRKNHIGGVIFSKGGPYREAKLTNEYQDLSRVPLLIAMDAEWGLAMRLDSTYAFPWNMTLGAIQDNKLVEEAGKRIGEQCKRLGVLMNFAPDVDINTNPKNPIIGNRSFGENKYNVAEKAIAFMNGMQGAGILGNAKHFPGHGDTDQDSHKTLPTVPFSRARIDSVELYPFEKIFNAGIASVMVAHLNVPSLEKKEGVPSSLSHRIVTEMLQDSLGYNGLVFTDALNMKGAANYDEPGDIDLAAFLAGNDVLLISEDITKAVSKIESAYATGVISDERLERSVKKILMAKYLVGLNHYKPINTKNLHSDLNKIQDDVLYAKLMENAITVVKNKQDLVPVRNLQDKKIAYVPFGDDNHEAFIKALQKYTQVDEIPVKDSTVYAVNTALQPYNTVIVGLHRSNESPWKPYEFTDNEKKWLQEIAQNHKVILDVFVKPYALLDIPDFSNIETVIVSYQNSDIAQEKSAEIIFGAIGAKGKLPVTANAIFPTGTGINTPAISRLQYGLPESVGMSSEKLKKVDSLARVAISGGMTPGSHILIARYGKVIYDKTFGLHAYGTDAKVQENDLYDLASLTKVLATLPNIIKLVDEGKLSLNATLGQMLPELKGSNKENLKLLNVLSHYARLKPWLPFYLETLDKSHHPSSKYYRKEPEGDFNVKVANHLYIRRDIEDSMFVEIKNTDLLPTKHYVYSDFAFYFMKRYLEQYYHKQLEDLVQDDFYKSLGANYTTFNPLDKFKKGDIVPAEIDDYYRYQVVQGTVHDMGAAMMGGVGGHAGLFSIPNDIAKIMQMYMNKGYYGGIQYFKPATFDKFNTCYFCKEDVRRGVGFDKPQLSGGGPTCGCVSMDSFGHSGFTGTYTWADPDSGILYVFLSNRTFPTAENNKLVNKGIRTKIQQYIYDAIMD